MNVGDFRGTIRCVVHLSGMRVYPGRRFWSRRIVFQMSAWRVDGQPVREQVLLVDFEALLGMAWRWRRRIAPGEVISFESTGITKMPRGGAFLRLSRFLGPAADPELQEIAAALRKPDVRSTTEFGRLVREPGEDDYSCSCTWHGTTLQLDLSPDDEGDVGATLAHARALHAGWERWEGQLRALVAGELLDLWKDWNADEPPIDGETLYGRLTLRRIWVMDDGAVQLEMDAGGQFTDHEVVIDGTVRGGPKEANLEG